MGEWEPTLLPRGRLTVPNTCSLSLQAQEGSRLFPDSRVSWCASKHCTDQLEHWWEHSLTYPHIADWSAHTSGTELRPEDP